ncbi:MAG TPA: hypothetical protein ENH91_03315 [Leeuwenhoekiella sp.]|nr:hypothetical protein [Leeuwenhoekiella sp.]
MHTEIKILSPIDYKTLRSGFAVDKSQSDCRDPLFHFSPLIKNFERLAVGRYFWFILDFPEAKHCASGGDVDYLTPFTLKEFSTLDQTKLNGATHPEDLNKVLAFSRFCAELFARHTFEAMSDFKISLFFRMMNSLEQYYWIMVQYPEVILDKNGNIVYGLVLVTDISHIKIHGEPMMNILNQKEQFCHQFFCLNENTLSKTEYIPPQLTRRETEILQLLTKGNGSKQIASMLNISTKTVDNHRQNMLHKTGSRSSSELVAMSIRLGMV